MESLQTETKVTATPDRAPIAPEPSDSPRERGVPERESMHFGMTRFGAQNTFSHDVSKLEQLATDFSTLKQVDAELTRC